jgi:hypothetical protein
MSNITPIINEDNIENIRQEIAKKINGPYFASQHTVNKITTDMDHHPYSRWFRGVYYYPEPIVLEREAGWRTRNDNCYNVITPMPESKQPEHCFEVPCSTILPCYPKYLTKYADKDSLDIMINNACINQYR